VEKVVREVVDSAGIQAEVRHVTDYAEIAARGVMSTPGLVIDGEVVMAGRIPTREQVASWLGIA
jgi:small redox-active disulfide protein 2